MPSKKKTPNKNTAGDNSIIINGDMNNSTIIIGDNSSLNASAPTRQSERPSERVLQPVVPSESTNSKLSPFLCYAKENSTGVREFRERLRAESWVDPWFDEEDILPGQMWEGSVTDAVHNSHAVIIFLSSIAIRTEGFFHKELKLALDA
ncbi:MAG TPA: toll/interleukin-1 receptor domain-containing protein, partial [Anaerolineales bacterium]|nr:toll/interleukin-1 receptor domain-containing protein [Anaerolineales bacterium]